MELKDLYWVAGIIEGEGTFAIHYERRNPYIRVTVKMTDIDVITRLQTITGIGTIRKVDMKDTGYKQAWSWDVAGQSNAASLMMTLYPIMSARRQERIKLCLKDWKSYQDKRHRPCPQGHDMTGDNLGFDQRGRRQCKTCRRESERKRYYKLQLDKMLYPS